MEAGTLGLACTSGAVLAEQSATVTDALGGMAATLGLASPLDVFLEPRTL